MNNQKLIGLKNILINNFSFLSNKSVVLLDIPNHRNIGDSLIWLGELELLKLFNCNLSYSSSLFTYSKHNIKDDVTILMHGGGNFGDLYPASQNFRLKIVEDFPDHDIVFLPQTVFYNDIENLKYDFKILRKHKKLKIAVRDNKSFNNLKDHFEESRLLLLPDMAFMLDFSDKVNDKKSFNGLILNRTDIEAKNDINRIAMNFFFESNHCTNIDTADWPTYGNTKFKNKIIDYLDTIEFKITKVSAKNKLFTHMIDSEFGLKSKKSLNDRVIKGINFINNYDAICSSRLHGLILSILLNKSVAISDNVYGKSTEFYNTWLKDFENIKFV